MSSRPRLGKPVVGIFTREDWERAWQMDSTPPPGPEGVPDTAILVRRTSPRDIQDRRIDVWIDEEPFGAIRYGEALTRAVQPGRHTVRVFNTVFTQTVTVEAQPGEHIRLQCGAELPASGWLRLIFLRFPWARVWLSRE